jgi:hypothetical protein
MLSLVFSGIEKRKHDTFKSGYQVSRMRSSSKDNWFPNSIRNPSLVSWSPEILDNASQES